VQNLGRKLNDWKPPWLRSGLTERVQNVLQLRTRVRWNFLGIVLSIVLLIALLSGCASPPQCPQAGQPPKELMTPPPNPGAMTERLEQILRRGQTSEPTSTP
jgi:hypothetical protein